MRKGQEDKPIDITQSLIEMGDEEYIEFIVRFGVKHSTIEMLDNMRKEWRAKYPKRKLEL